MDRESKYFTLTRSPSGPLAVGRRIVLRGRCRYSRRARVRIHGPGRRLKASGSSPVAGSARLGCAFLPWRRMPSHARSATLLRHQPPARRAWRRRAPTRIRCRMSIRPSTSLGRRPMPHWRLNSTTPAIHVSVTPRSAGRSSKLPRKCARSCGRCPPAKRARVVWTRSSTSWMRASALATRKAGPGFFNIGDI